MSVSLCFDLVCYFNYDLGLSGPGLTRWPVRDFRSSAIAIQASTVSALSLQVTTLALQVAEFPAIDRLWQLCRRENE